MGDTPPRGMGSTLDAIARRVMALESFLAQYRRKSIVATTPQGGTQAVDVLGIDLGQDTPVVPTFGAFFGMRSEGGKVMFQGGTIRGTSPDGATVTVKDLEVVSATVKPADMEGKLLWVEITFDGQVQNGKVIPGGYAKSVRCDPKSTVGKELPNSTYPTKSSPTGRKIYFELGRWTKAGFVPSSSIGGNYILTWCPGNLIVQRNG